MSLVSSLDDYQQRHHWLGFPIAVVYKFLDDQGSYLAALMAYYAFISLFPLLLILSTVLGLVLAGDPSLQRQVIDSALGQFPGLGTDLVHPKRLGGGTQGLVIGILGALYGGLGVAQAAQNAMNNAWAVPRNSRPNPLKGRARSLQLLATVGFAVLATTALTGIVSAGGGIAQRLGVVFTLGVLLVTIALNAVIFAIAFRIATARELSARDVAPGAVAAAIAWQALQTGGASYVKHVASSDSVTSATFGVVLGLIAFLYVASVVIMFCVEINVVRVERLFPRALLTPFTDDVDLTRGDKDAYAGRAEAQRAKGFQEVDVSFGPRPRREKEPG